MKKLVLLAMLMVASVSFAQLKRVEEKSVPTVEIGKIQPLGGTILMGITKSGDTYTFKYKNTTFKTIEVHEEFVLEDTGSDFETLYSMIQEGFETLPEDLVVLELKNHMLYLKFDKFLGAPVVSFSSRMKGVDALGISQQFSKKQVDKIFGKKK